MLLACSCHGKEDANTFMNELRSDLATPRNNCTVRRGEFMTSVTFTQKCHFILTASLNSGECHTSDDVLKVHLPSFPSPKGNRTQ